MLKHSESAENNLGGASGTSLPNRPISIENANNILAEENEYDDDQEELDKKMEDELESEVNKKYQQELQNSFDAKSLEQMDNGNEDDYSDDEEIEAKH